MDKRIVLIFLFFTIFYIGIASAGLGVVSEYAEVGNAMLLYSGQSSNTYFKIQNSDMAHNMTVEAEITEGAEISSLITGSSYEVKGGEQKVAYLRVSVPKNASVGTRYFIEVLFRQVQQSSGGGAIGFVFNVDRGFWVQVIAPPLSIDQDGDYIIDELDNCISIANFGQEDFDSDGIGDVCDAQTCGNAVVEDAEECDDGNLIEGDGCSMTCELEDSDRDGIIDGLDNCPTAANPNQANNDNDGSGDVCDDDDDNDGILDTNDNCQFENPLGIDANIDGCIDTLEGLILLTKGFNLQQGISNSLDSKLQNAWSALTDFKEGNTGNAVNKIEAFINEVEAQRGNKITNEQADLLVAMSGNVIFLI